ncbi:MAG: hypothetical protein ACLTMP_04225 [Eggerthella lenta]
MANLLVNEYDLYDKEFLPRTNGRRWLIRPRSVPARRVEGQQGVVLGSVRQHGEALRRSQRARARRRFRGD